MRRAVSVPNVGEPAQLLALAADVEAAGWDGFFVWDHVQIVEGMGFEVHDPWMILAGAARATSKVKLGTLVAVPSRRRPWVMAKQMVTLDHLSDGRAILGVGLGFPPHDEFGAFGEESGIANRASRTDEALEIIDRVLRGEAVDHSGDHFEVSAHLLPAAVQQPRPRIWAAATPPYRRPLERARRWDGVVCNVKVDDDLMPLRPDELRSYVGDFLDDPLLDVVTNPHPDHAPDEYEAVGVDWLVHTALPGENWMRELRRLTGLG